MLNIVHILEHKDIFSNTRQLTDIEDVIVLGAYHRKVTEGDGGVGWVVSKEDSLGGDGGVLIWGKDRGAYRISEAKSYILFGLYRTSRVYCTTMHERIKESRTFWI